MGVEASMRLRSQASKPRDLWQLGVLPMFALGAVSGLIGVYWDIAWHIDLGRDTFFTPPHNFIYLAMVIVILCSLYGLIRDRRDTPLHIHLGRFRLNPGVLIVMVGAILDLFFAPADDLWHRLYGPDVTLWGPMHLVGLTGLTMLSFGGLLSSYLEHMLSEKPARKRLFGIVALFFASVLLGWTMLFLAEYEYNVPAFPMFWHPLLLAALPVFVLVLIAKLRPVGWAATWTTLLFTGFRLALFLGLSVTSRIGWAGVSKPAIPLLILSGLLIDLMMKQHLPIWLISLSAAGMSFFANYPLIYFSEINWYTSALVLGFPIGLLVAVILGYLADAVANALEPQRLCT